MLNQRIPEQLHQSGTLLCQIQGTDRKLPQDYLLILLHSLRRCTHLSQDDLDQRSQEPQELFENQV